jgi:hypothetical protein
MSRVARNAFSLFTDEEISDIYTFLQLYHGVNTPQAATTRSSSSSPGEDFLSESGTPSKQPSQVSKDARIPAGR